jgi:hypothetical protein
MSSSARSGHTLGKYEIPERVVRLKVELVDSFNHFSIQRGAAIAEASPRVHCAGVAA